MENTAQLQELLVAMAKALSIQNESLSALILTIQSDPVLSKVYEEKIIELRQQNGKA